MKKRNDNIEILRVVAMLFIIMHHLVINNYGLQSQLKNGIMDLRYTSFLCWLNAVVIIGANIFF